MKKIINGVRYDTDKAIQVGTASSLGSTVKSARAPGYWKAALYVTPRANRYFLAGQGNTMTRFTGQANLIPITRDEALAWAKKHLTRKEIKTHFPDLA